MNSVMNHEGEAVELIFFFEKKKSNVQKNTLQVASLVDFNSSIFTGLSFENFQITSKTWTQIDFLFCNGNDDHRER